MVKENSLDRKEMTEENLEYQKWRKTTERVNIQQYKYITIYFSHL